LIEALRPWQNLIVLTVVLAGPVLVSAALRALPRLSDVDLRTAGRVGITLFLLMTASAHFLRPDQLAIMLPEWVPERIALVYATGVLEIALAIAVWIRPWVQIVGVGIAIMLLLFLPANIYAAWNSLPFGGNELGPPYLLVRVPYQFFVIGWVLWATGWYGAFSPGESDYREE
jgi:uncharacterized membrane protein